MGKRKGERASVEKHGDVCVVKPQAGKDITDFWVTVTKKIDGLVTRRWEEFLYRGRGVARGDTDICALKKKILPSLPGVGYYYRSLTDFLRIHCLGAEEGVV